MNLSVILEVLSDYVEYDPENIGPETDLIKDLKLSSYDRISLLGDLERRLGIEVPEEEIARLVTLADVEALIDTVKK